MRQERQRLKALLFTLWLLLSPVMGAMPASAQGSNAVKHVTLNLTKAPVKEFFDELKAQTGLNFFYSSELARDIPTVTLRCHDESVDKVMATVFSGTGYTYKLESNFVTVKKNQNSRLKSITGRITDSERNSLPGASIYVKGTDCRTITDANGNFTLFVPREATTVTASFIGMKTRNVRIPESGAVNISLEDSQNVVDEVVVTGYGNTLKGNYTGAMTKLKADDIMLAGASSIDQMLQGVVPGMLVQQETGMVGASPKIRVRGTSSLLGSQNPVWVVDGVIQHDPQPFNSDDNTKFSVDADDISRLAGNAISWLNPNDIESITVLKDASATAIYGSEAANGVIVITTKKSTAGKVSISYSGDFSIGQRPSYGLYNQMNSAELMEFSKQMYEDRVQYPSTVLPIGYAGIMQQYLDKKIDKAEFSRLYQSMATQNTDWFSLLFRNSFSQKHSVSISGGSEQVQNRTSLGYTGEDGEAKGNSSRLFTATSNTTMNLFDNRLIINVLLKGSWRRTNGFAYGVDPFTYAYGTSRAIPAYNEDGTLYYHERWADEESTVIHGKNSYNYNILNELANTGSENNTKTWGATVDLKWRLLPHLEYQGLFSYSSSSADTKQYATERSFYATALRGYEYGAYESSAEEFSYSRMPFGGLLETGLTDVTSYTVRNALVYDNTFKNLHRLTAQIGIETNSTRTKGNTNTRYGYLRDRGETFAELPLTYYDPSLDETEDNPFVRGAGTVLNKTNNKLSEYLSAAYTFDNRYVVNGSARLDASNRFGQDKNKRFEPAWSLGLKWRAASERFMQPIQSVVNNLDFIASYGYQGNSVETVSPYLIAKDGGVNEYYNAYVLNISSLPYPNLGWEKTKTWNLGVDASFLNGRLNFTFNWFRKVSSVLSSRNIPWENGVGTAIVNGGELANTGYDFVINVIPIRTKDFLWQLSLNTSVTSNEVCKNQRVNTLDDYLDGSAVVDGEAFSTFYSYKFAGLDPENGTPTFENMDVEDAETPLAYLVKSGKYTPDFSGGLNTMLKYKNWSLYALFAIQWGGHSRLPDLYDTSSNYGVPTPEQNVSRDLASRWRKAGDETNIPSIPTADAYIDLPTTATVASTEARLYDMYNKSDQRVAKTDFIRCRSLSLSYDFSQELLKSIGIKRLVLKASMTNPFMWVRDKKWNGIDPETGSWPTRRVTSLSLQVMF